MAAVKTHLIVSTGSTSPTTQTPSAPGGGQINYGGSVTPGSADHLVAIQPSSDAPVHPMPQLANEGLSAANIAAEQQQNARQ